MREHLHASQVAGAFDFEGSSTHAGGGNMGADILGGYIGSVGTGSTFLAYGSDPSGDSSGPFGGGVTQLTKVVLHIAAFWIISIAVLILLHRAGFRFSLTVGG